MSEGLSTPPSRVNQRAAFFEWRDVSEYVPQAIKCATRILLKSKKFKRGGRNDWATYGVKPGKDPDEVEKENQVVGVLGEIGFAIAADRLTEINGAWWKRRCSGRSDGGVDFSPMIDVKGNKYWHDPYLRVSPAQLEKWPDVRWYCLVAVDLDRERTRVIGWASRAQVEAAPLEDLGSKYPCHVLRSDELRNKLKPRRGAGK